MGETGDRAAGDVAHRVPARAGRGEARCVQPVEDVRERVESEVVELDVLPRRQLALAAAVDVRDLADRAQLRGRDDPARDLHAEHERPDLRLVVVEPPPLQPHDVLLGHPLVPGRDQRRQLVEHPERALLALEPLDRIALEDEFERWGIGGFGCQGRDGSRKERSRTRPVSRQSAGTDNTSESAEHRRSQPRH